MSLQRGIEPKTVWTTKQSEHMLTVPPRYNSIAPVEPTRKYLDVTFNSFDIENLQNFLKISKYRTK